MESQSPCHPQSQQQENYDEENDNYDMNVMPSLHSQSSQYSDLPILSYSYSGISNASSNPELTMHSSRVCEEITYFNFIKAQKLYCCIQKQVEEVKEVLLLEEDIILYLLFLHKWDRERLYEHFLKHSQIYTNKNSILKSKLQMNEQNTSEVCSVCLQNKTLFGSLLCEHKYCTECWHSYVKQKLQSNCIFFPCMNKCAHSPVLIHVFVQKMLPDLFELYRKMICINYANVNKSISYCPGKCDAFCERTQALFDSSVQCLCGEFYCFFCQEEPHFPAACEDVAKWKRLINKQQGNLQWIYNNTKNCPSCKSPVQKSIGCSKVTCLCGIQFCYDCNSIWDSVHKSKKGECLQGIKKQNSQISNDSALFAKVVQKVMSISVTLKKNIASIGSVFENVKQEWILAKFHGVRKEVSDAWLALKWGSVASFLYKRTEVDHFIQQQFIQSITKLMEAIEKAQQTSISLFPKQLLGIGDQVISKREVLRKNKQVWMQVWRST